MTRLLVLGGTGFIGPDIVGASAAAGMDVTIASRGRTGHVPAGIRYLGVDRSEPDWPANLGASDWDIVIDTWAGQPGAVATAASALAGRVGVYAYLSTLSVYRQPLPDGFDESAPTVATTPDAGDPAYPSDKRAAETAVEEALGAEATLIVRPGAIVGPRENTRRLLRWLARAADGGPLLAPGTEDSPLQWIDTRDLATFTVTAAAASVRGHFNTVSPPARFGELVDAVVGATGHRAEVVWVEESFLLRHGVAPFADLPLWLDAAGSSLYTASAARARDAGLGTRPLADTVRDTWHWMNTSPGHPAVAARPLPGMDREREAKLLRAWRDHPST